MPTPDEETRRDVQAALAARRELGMEYEEAIAAGLLDRVNQLALMRAGDLRREAERIDHEAKAETDSRTQRFVLGIVSLGAGIPITAISSSVEPGLLGVAIAWAGIVGVNVAAGLGARRRPQDR
ncbi:MAG TPA: hypothetical protein VE617_05080 [Propionibacteriaceae bacterium]|nr:hypothetical protein [Propionibacteriaceae bacterium]